MNTEKIENQKQQILDLLRDFCSQKLDEEYFKLAERLTLKLARKRNRDVYKRQGKRLSELKTLMDQGFQYIWV